MPYALCLMVRGVKFQIDKATSYLDFLFEKLELSNKHISRKTSLKFES